MMSDPTFSHNKVGSHKKQSPVAMNSEVLNHLSNNACIPFPTFVNTTKFNKKLTKSFFLPEKAYLIFHLF